MMAKTRRLGVRQATTFDCGPAAGVNALAARRVARSLAEMRRLCGTSQAGTSPKGLIRGLNLVCASAGLRGPELFHTSPKEGHVVLASKLANGVAVLPFKASRAWDHWVVALSSRADLVCVQDSAVDELRWLTWAEVISLWEGPGGPKEQVFGVAL